MKKYSTIIILEKPPDGGRQVNNYQVQGTMSRSCCGSVDVRPRSLNREVPGSNLMVAAVVPLGKALYPHCLVPLKGLKAFGPLVACL